MIVKTPRRMETKTVAKPQPTGLNQVKLLPFLKAIDHFRCIHQEFPPQRMLILLHIALTPGENLRSLADKIKLDPPSISRHIAKLSDHQTFDRPGHGLIRYEENPHNRKEKLLYLTKRGEDFLKALVELLA